MIGTRNGTDRVKRYTKYSDTVAQCGIMCIFFMCLGSRQ